MTIGDDGIATRGNTGASWVRKNSLDPPTQTQAAFDRQRLIQSANNLIGKRARVKKNNVRPELESLVGTIDKVCLDSSGASLRIVIPQSELIEFPEDAIEYCTCGEGDGCYLCAEKPLNANPIDGLRDVLANLEIIDTTKLAGKGLFKEAEAVGKARVLIDEMLRRPNESGRPVLIAPSFSSGGIPRRIRIDRMVPAELAIRNAVIAVEEAGADPLLTEAVILLHKAQEKVADYIDGSPQQGV